MSLEASIKIKGEKHSAWYYRELYLEDNIVYDKFFCPYCDVELFGRNIYRDRSEELVKQPYFASFPEPKLGHAKDCDYAAGEKIKKNGLGVQGSHGESSLSDGPEIFAVRPESYWEDRADNAGKSLAQRHTGTPLAQNKSFAGGAGERKTVSRIYAMRTFAEYYNLIVSESFKLRDKNGWSDEKFKKYKNEELMKHNIVFSKDNATNYRYGFISPWSEEFINFKKERIYLGKGHLEKKGNLYRITKNKLVLLKNGSSVPFYVAIDVKVNEFMPQTHKDIMDFIEKASVNIHDFYDVKWFVRGIPVVKDSSVVLYLRNLDFLFLKK